MTPILIIAAAVWIASALLFVLHTITAPTGREDESGFHEGDNNFQ